MNRKKWFSNVLVSSSSTKRAGRRRLRVESLESRALMAADVVHNFVMPHDVDDDGSVTPLDALVVINRLNRGADDSSSTSIKFHDVDDDSTVSPLDALVVINRLNNRSASEPERSEVSRGPIASPGATTSVRARVELETVGAETELKIRVDNAPASKSLDVILDDIALGQLVTDSRGRGELVLSRGDDNRNHLPLPPSIQTLSNGMEIAIGDIVRGQLGSVTKLENRVGATPATPSPATPPSTPSTTSPTPSTPAATTPASLALVARFDPVAGVTRSAEYEQQTEKGVTKRKFKAEIDRAAPNTKLDVLVGGVVVGSITTDARGKGTLRLTTQPKDARDTPMPANFPAVAVGTMVAIGGVSSPFVLTPA